MCYLCSCFSWTLDLIQRIITFALSCLIAFAVCCGMSIAIIAGIAYGYNYSLAEFLTFTRSDVTAFMRRNHFFDNPNIIFPRTGRRSDEGEDILSTKIIADYQDNSIIRSDYTPSTYVGLKTKGTRKYAEKITKYINHNPTIIDTGAVDKQTFFKLTSSPSRRIISIAPVPGISTTLLQSGSSEIIMRNFIPLEQMPVFENINTNNDFVGSGESVDAIPKKTIVNSINDMATNINNNKIHLERNMNEGNSLMQSRPTLPPAQTLDYPMEDLDEDRIVYKPV